MALMKYAREFFGNPGVHVLMRCGFAVIAGLAAVIGVSQTVERRTSTVAPEEIRLADLGARNPDANKHLLVTHFDFCEDLTVIMKEHQRWKEVWSRRGS